MYVYELAVAKCGLFVSYILGRIKSVYVSV